MTIHHADALDIIADLGEFDYLITDPPYPVGGESSMTTTKSQLQVVGMMESMAASLLGGAVKAIRKKPDFVAWIMCDWRMIGAYRRTLLGAEFQSQRCLVWDKGIHGMGSVYMPKHEHILVASSKGAMQRRLKSIGAKQFISYDIIPYQRLPGEGSHAFSKPPGLVEKFFGNMPRGRVIDPFCGSGGLLVGAKKLGNEVVGIEMVEESCTIARERLDEVRHSSM